VNKLFVALLSSTALLVTVAGASAADLPARPVYKAAPMAAPAFSWTGIYVGGNVGYGWGRTRGTAATSAPGGLPGQSDLDGIVGGGQIGANYQVGAWVFGIEADYQGASVDGSKTAGAFTDTAEVERYGTLRGRIGYAWDRWLAYGTGGYAFGARTNYNFVTPAAFSGAGSRDLDGWAAGGGLEYAFAPNWSAKVEYMHVNLDTKAFTSLPCVAASCRVGADIDTVRLGVNYRFSGLGWR
jgi:outer membrane immunogenic protein